MFCAPIGEKNTENNVAHIVLIFICFVLLRKSCVNRVKSYPACLFQMNLFSIGDWEMKIIILFSELFMSFLFLINGHAKRTKIQSKRKKKKHPAHVLLFTVNPHN